VADFPYDVIAPKDHRSVKLNYQGYLIVCRSSASI